MIAEKLSNGLSTTAIGVTTVFIVLILLWGMVELMRIAMSFAEGTNKKKEVVSAPVSAPKVIENKIDDGEIVAAISAAVTVYLDVPQSSFKIKSFKRIGSNFKR